MFWDFILDLIYKNKCLTCSCLEVVENFDNLLCITCAQKITYFSNNPFRIYKGVNIYSACLYDETVKKLIWSLKFSHRKKASVVLAKILFNYFQKLNLNNDYIIVYPPTFFLKSAQRGYEHMFLIAKEFSKLTGLEYDRKLIKKIKNTKPQYKAHDRFKNIKNSFKITKYTDKKILLIDDITTSGATVEEIINCFLNKGIKNITCLTISKTIHNF